MINHEQIQQLAFQQTKRATMRSYYGSRVRLRYPQTRASHDDPQITVLS